MEVLKGYGAPSSSTRGEKDDLYVDVVNETIYKCLGIANPGVDLGYVTTYRFEDNQYIWEVNMSGPYKWYKAYYKDDNDHHHLVSNMLNYKNYPADDYSNVGIANFDVALAAKTSGNIGALFHLATQAGSLINTKNFESLNFPLIVSHLHESFQVLVTAGCLMSNSSLVLAVANDGSEVIENCIAHIQIRYSEAAQAYMVRDIKRNTYVRINLNGTIEYNSIMSDTLDASLTKTNQPADAAAVGTALAALEARIAALEKA